MDNNKIYNGHRDNRLKDMGESEMELFLTNLKRKCKQAGLAVSDESVIEDLPKFMTENFPKNSGTDIINCLELYMAGDINLKDQLQFNLKFLGKLLNGFEPLLTEATRDVVNKIIKEKQLAAAKENDKQMFDSLISYIQKEKKFPYGWNWFKVFNYMHSSGIIEWNEEIKNKFYESWKQLQLADLNANRSDKRIDIDKQMEVLNDLDSLGHRLQSEYIKSFLKSKLQEIINGTLFHTSLINK